MIGNKPSIYNAQSVYNQGGVKEGGGGDGTFIIGDQTFYFPTYLTPVEYVDTTEFSGNLSVIAAKQWEFKQNHFAKVVISYDRSTVTNGMICVFQQTLDYSISNGNVQLNIYGDSHDGVQWYYGPIQCTQGSMTSLQTTDKVTLTINMANKTLIVRDEHGHTWSKSSSLSYTAPRWGKFSFFGLPQQNPTVSYKGKLFYMYVKSGDIIEALFVPAKMKDGTSNDLHIVECVSGVVAKNWTTTFGGSGIAFGPDITFEDIAAYFT